MQWRKLLTIILKMWWIISTRRTLGCFTMPQWTEVPSKLRLRRIPSLSNVKRLSVKRMYSWLSDWIGDFRLPLHAYGAVSCRGRRCWYVHSKPNPNWAFHVHINNIYWDFYQADSSAESPVSITLTSIFLTVTVLEHCGHIITPVLACYLRCSRQASQEANLLKYDTTKERQKRQSFWREMKANEYLL